VRTDLGGLYFNAIVAVAITGLWWWLDYDALLLVVATQIVQMLRQLGPMVRFDGYHVLADITGVPDLYSRIKPTLLSLLPWRWGDPHAKLLKPWARILVTVWVLVVVPLLICTMATAVLALPRLIGTAWAALDKQSDVLSTAWADGDMIQTIARVLAIVAILIPVAGVIYMMVRITRRSVAGAWRTTAGKPVMRALAILLGAAVVTGVAYAWWPGDGRYRPIQPWERGTVGDIVYALGVERIKPTHSTATLQPAASSRKLVKGQRGIVRSLWDTRTRPPTFTQPQLAVILIPKTIPAPRVGSGGAFAPTTSAGANVDEGWVFPVSKPLAPEPGDTQALAVNTTDNTVEYEAAFAMIWVDDNSDAMNVNEAQAYASCDSCAAVAVAYQVVFVIDSDETDDNVAAPQNLAGALNYNCVNCLTYALAEQLFITLDRPLTTDEMAALNAVWARIQELEQRIDNDELTLAEIDTIDDQLAAYTDQIKTIVAPAMVSTTAPSTAVQVTSQAPAPTASSTAASPTAPTSTATPPSSTAATTAATTASPTPTSSSTPSSSASAPAPITNSEPTSSGSTPTGTTSDGSTPSGTTSDGTTSGGTTDGSTSGGTATSP
jgi:putative peptide zinc metalloprotease protein